MPVSLTGKIIPLNAGFVGMVDCNQVLDTATTSGNIPISDGSRFISTVPDFGDGSHFHDGDTLQLDGINSNGGTFDFITSGTINFKPSGDTTHYLQLYTFGNAPFFKAIGQQNTFFTSDDGTGVGIVAYQDANRYAIFGTYGTSGEYDFILTTHELRIQANLDLDDYLSISTTTNQTTINFAGQNGKITASGGTIDFDNENLTTTGTFGAGAITGTSFIIGANTLTTTEWAFLDGQDQSVFTTSSPQFASLGIGTAAVANRAINALTSYTAIDATIFAMSFTPIWTPTGTSSYGLYGIASYPNAQGGYAGDTIVAFFAQPSIRNTAGTIDSVRGVYIQPETTALFGGTITKCRGIDIPDVAKSGAGTITTATAIHLAQQTKGTTNWQIYSAGGNSAFGGNTRFGGVTAPTVALDVTGAGLFTGSLGAGAITGTSLKANGTLSILEGGGTPTKYTIFQGGDQAIDLTYTLPVAYPAVSGYVLSSTDAGVMSWVAGGAGGGYTNLTEFVAQTAWRLFYSNADGDVTELAFGTDGQVLTSTGASTAPNFEAPPVISVTASGTTLTISPTTGAVLAAINLTNANTWTGAITMGTTTKINFTDTNAFINASSSGTLVVQGATQTQVGVVGDIILGDSTLRIMYPQTAAKIDLGSSTYPFNDVWCGSITITDAENIILNTTTGTKIGTATSQKLGFYNATPVVQPAGTTDVLASLVTLGLRAASSNPPLNLGTGAVTCGKIVFGAPTELTIASGVVTVTGSYHKIDTEGDAATDNLETINGGSAGQLLVLECVNGARAVTVVDGGGNIQLAGSTNFTMDNSADKLLLICNLAGTAWEQISQSGNAT